MPRPSDADLMTAGKVSLGYAATARRPRQTPCDAAESMIVVANVISGPADLKAWILESFAATFDTLDQVGGVRQFRLDRLAGTGNRCLFVSYTFWNSLADFDRWRTSAAFVAAHPDRTTYRDEFSRMWSARYDLRADPTTDIDDLRTEIRRLLSSTLPDVDVGSKIFVSEIHWTPGPSDGIESR